MKHTFRIAGLKGNTESEEKWKREEKKERERVRRNERHYEVWKNMEWKLHI